jgi:hypothetical protein
LRWRAERPRSGIVNHRDGYPSRLAASVKRFTSSRCESRERIIGGLIAGLSIVFILPHFDDIGQLCLLTAVVAAFAGWVTTSSERLSYAGMQIALAFFMGILQTYSPATDLTVQRETAWSASSWAMS